MRVWLALAFAVALGSSPGAGGQAALAQGIPLNPLAQLKLTEEDMAKAAAATDQLYQAQAIGKVAEWSNDASGNRGRVRLLQIFQYEGYDCREVQHVIKTRGNPDANTLVFRSCLAEDGTWKFI